MPDGRATLESDVILKYHDTCLRFASKKFWRANFGESSVCKVFSGRAHTFCNFIASWIRTKFIGSPRHPSRISQLIPSRQWREHNAFAPFTFGLKWIKNYEAQNISKIKRNGEWNVLWLQHTPQIYFYHHKLEQQFVSAIGKKKKRLRWSVRVECFWSGHPIKKSFADKGNGCCSIDCLHISSSVGIELHTKANAKP